MKRDKLYRNLNLRNWLIFSFCSFVVLMSISASNAQSKGSERLTQIKMTENRTALFKAEELYKNYWGGFNLTFDKSIPSSASYLTLRRGSSRKDFIIYKRQTERGGICARLGCEYSIFENTGKNQWRLILHVFTNDIYVSNKRVDGYPDILVESYAAAQAENLGKKGSDDKNRFLWTGDKYLSIKYTEVER